MFCMKNILTFLKKKNLNKQWDPLNIPGKHIDREGGEQG